jgi:O-antigen ligase
MKQDSSTSSVKRGTPQKNDFSLIHWLPVLALSLFFFIYPFELALFNGQSSAFESSIYKAMIYIFILLIPVAVFLFRKWQIDRAHSVLAVGVLLLPIVYLTASFAGVVIHNAQLMTVIHFMYAALFIAGLYLAYGHASRKFLEWAVILSGYTIILYGLMNLFGQVYYPDAMWLAHDGYRLASVFQYSNTYAGYLSAFLFVALHAVTTRKNRLEISIHAIMLVPIILSIMLTLSRGALVFVPFLLLFFLLFLRINRQIIYTLHLGMAMVATFVILGTITDITSQIAAIVQPTEAHAANPISLFDKLPLQGWAILLICSLVVVACSFAIHRWMSPWLDNRISKLQTKRWAVAYVPVALASIGAGGAALLLASPLFQGLLPDNISSRLADINFQQHSVLERITFYADAMKVVADYPLFGAGGGAWGSLYEQYQNNPYISRQAHSYFIQTLVEVGLVGFVLIIGFLLTCFIAFIRLYHKFPEHREDGIIFFIISSSILTHSLIDFDMSFVYVGSLVFFCIGAMLSPLKNNMAIPWLSNYNTKVWRTVFPASVIVLSIVMLTWVFRENAAIQNFEKAIAMANENKPLNQLLPAIDNAINLSPTQTEFSLMKIDWLIQAHRQTGDISYNEAARDAIIHSKRYVTHNRSLLLSEYRNLKGFGEYNQAVKVLEEGIQKFQWDINFYEAAIMEYLQNGLRVANTAPLDAQQSWNRGLELFHEITRRMELLKDLPEEQLQGRAFDITPFTRQAIGQIYYELGNFTAAHELLVPLTTADLSDPNNRIGVRFYLATLNKLGQNDENLKNLLIAADEHERIALESLIAEQ